MLILVILVDPIELLLTLFLGITTSPGVSIAGILSVYGAPPGTTPHSAKLNIDLTPLNKPANPPPLPPPKNPPILDNKPLPLEIIVSINFPWLPTSEFNIFC